jgi:hypothetical protein
MQYRGMILGLSGPAARALLVRLGLDSRGQAVDSAAWTDDRKSRPSWTPVELPWISGNDLRVMHPGVSRLPGAKFGGRTRGGSASIDVVRLVPRSVENTKQ